MTYFDHNGIPSEKVQRRRVSTHMNDRNPRTSFDDWCLQMQFTSQEAADKLGMSLSRVQELRAGVKYGRDSRKALPDKTLRLAMVAIERRLDPWPE